MNSIDSLVGFAYVRQSVGVIFDYFTVEYEYVFAKINVHGAEYYD